jgi:hypothetical protein
MAKRIVTQTDDNGEKRVDELQPTTVNRIVAQLVDDQIRPGAGGIITDIPQESIYDDADLGDEVDLAKNARKKLRKPGRREWIVLNRASEYQTRLLVHSPRKDDIEKEHYWVHPNLRVPEIRDELKGHRIFLYYSTRAKAFRLWPVPVTEGNSWYESLVALLGLDESWFHTHEIKIIPDQTEGEYRVRKRTITQPVTWPDKPVSEILAETLGLEHIITVADHPVYRDIISGEHVELD